MSDPTLTRGADAAYRDALIERLGGADPVQELSKLFERLPRVLVGLTDAQLREPEASGKWSVLEVIQHMADAELVQGMRIRRILVEDRPTLAPMDQDRWVEHEDYLVLCLPASAEAKEKGTQHRQEEYESAEYHGCQIRAKEPGGLCRRTQRLVAFRTEGDARGAEPIVL